MELSREIGLNAEFLGKPFANIYDLAFDASVMLTDPG